MVVLVTGGSGFIGSHIVDELIKEGYHVRVFDIRQPRREDVKWFKGNILNYESLYEACYDVEYIYHLAAIADVNVAYSNPELCIKVNELGTMNVLRAAVDREVERVILASTTWVYGKTGGVVTEETPLPPPDNVYTKTKIGQEHIVIAWHNSQQLPYTILRYGIPYGERMRSNMAIAIFVRKALNREQITICGSGNQGRCFIYIKDLAEGNVAALKSQAKKQIINLAGKEFISINQIISELKKIIGDISVEYKPSRPGDFRGAVISIKKAEKLLGWRPKVPFNEGLSKYIDYVKKLAGCKKWVEQKH